MFFLTTIIPGKIERRLKVLSFFTTKRCPFETNYGGLPPLKLGFTDYPPYPPSPPEPPLLTMFATGNPSAPPAISEEIEGREFRIKYGRGRRPRRPACRGEHCSSVFRPQKSPEKTRGDGGGLGVDEGVPRKRGTSFRGFPERGVGNHQERRLRRTDRPVGTPVFILSLFFILSCFSFKRDQSREDRFAVFICGGYMPAVRVGHGFGYGQTEPVVRAVLVPCLVRPVKAVVQV